MWASSWFQCDIKHHSYLQGITYDTGGADLKVGGVMKGMHRDKCGAAFVAGFFQVRQVESVKLSMW